MLGIHIGTAAAVLAKMVGDGILQPQGGKMGMGDAAVPDVGKNGKRIFRREQRFPVEGPRRFVERLVGGAGKSGQGSEHARDQARAIIDAVQSRRVGAKMQAAAGSFDLVGAQLRQLGAGQFLQSARHLGEIATVGLIGEHGFSGLAGGGGPGPHSPTCIFRKARTLAGSWPLPFSSTPLDWVQSKWPCLSRTARAG